MTPTKNPAAEPPPLPCDAFASGPIHAAFIRAVTPNPAAVALGALGGKVRSPAKAAASRANGRKGGRPRKTRAQPVT